MNSWSFKMLNFSILWFLVANFGWGLNVSSRFLSILSETCLKFLDFRHRLGGSVKPSQCGLQNFETNWFWGEKTRNPRFLRNTPLFYQIFFVPWWVPPVLRHRDLCVNRLVKIKPMILFFSHHSLYTCALNRRVKILMRRKTSF